MSKHDSRRRGGGFIFTAFRLILSLVVLVFLFLALYQAFKGFSGLDPLKVSPQALIQEFSSTETLYGFVKRLLTFDIRSPSLSGELSRVVSNTTAPTSTPQGNFLFRFAVVSDSHNDNLYLTKAFNIARNQDAKFVIGLGDYTDVGMIDELTLAKEAFQGAGLPYYTTAGDHDLWDSRNQKLIPDANFVKIFGPTYASFGYQDFRFIIIYNADNYLGVDAIQRQWLEEELKRVAPTAKATLIFGAIPLYHPSSDHIMGKTEPNLKSQARDLLQLFKTYHIKAIFAGDTHFYSSYLEPTTSIPMYSIGAVTSSRNPQAPRFVLVDVYDSGDYSVADTEIK